MEIIEADNSKLKNQYIEFMRSVYGGNINYKDINAVFVKNFLFKEDLFSKKCDVFPILVKENNNILACAILITYPLASDVFLSFFEALPSQEKAVDLIINYARKKTEEKGKAKIIVGINGHISYTVGILANNYGMPQTFDSNYNPEYYLSYFEKYCITKREAVSYNYDLKKIIFDGQVLEGVYSNVSFRKLNKRNYKKDILIFGDLCDKALSGTPFYYEKTKEEMYSSLAQMKYVFNEDNIIFAVKDGREVGFLLMHPDYNQLINGQKVTPFKILIGLLFKKKKMDTIIINIIGVLPEYQNNKIIVGLLNEAHKIVNNKYKRIVSTFIMKDNLKSTRLCSSFSSGELNRYFIYEIGI